MPQAAALKDKRAIRFALCGLAIIFFAWAMVCSGRIGISKMFVKFVATVVIAAPADAVSAADNGLQLTPADAELHYARSAAAAFVQDEPTAIRELEQAISLRPRDYYLWLELGLARDRVGDQPGALTAFNESMHLAPYYAQPRWLRGNVLFRMGKYDEAFVDLREAATSNPNYLPAFIDLSFRASRKDATLTEQLVQPKTDRTQTEMAYFFARNGKPDDALAHFNSIRAVTPEIRQNLVRDLIAANAMRQAFTVWSLNNQESTGTIYDGGFEGPLSLDESGFGWRVSSPQAGLSLSLDSGQPKDGARSLRISFSGHANPGFELLTQLVPVEPGGRYKLNFSARTSNLVTGGPVVVVVKDVSNQQILARSAPLPTDTKAWQPFSTEFTVGPGTTAIKLAVQREGCATSPCPVFGAVNFDGFSLESVKTSPAK
jgi:hypothetical protein